MSEPSENNRGVRPVAAEDFPDWDHRLVAHCENGVTTSLFRHAGLDLSEPMVFGVGGGVFFAHLSFFKVMGLPLSTFRSFPGRIFLNACDRLGVACHRETFARPEAGMRRLDELLEAGQPVGLQLNIFWLPYVPRPMRVHFNGHNLVALARRGDDYVVSDPVFDELYLCPRHLLRRARFSGGARFMTRGLLYYPTSVPAQIPLREGVDHGLRQVCQHMLRIPSPLKWFGLRGIEHLGREIPQWPDRVGTERAEEWLAGVVRMQEEIGTGGAGFRYLFAAFLQQAGEELGLSELQAVAEQANAVGDRWRGFALHASRMARGKPDLGWDGLGAMVRDIGVDERALFSDLDRIRAGGPALLSGGAG